MSSLQDGDRTHFEASLTVVIYSSPWKPTQGLIPGEKKGLVFCLLAGFFHLKWFCVCGYRTRLYDENGHKHNVINAGEVPQPAQRQSEPYVPAVCSWRPGWD